MDIDLAIARRETIAAGSHLGADEGHLGILGGDSHLCGVTLACGQAIDPVFDITASSVFQRCWQADGEDEAINVGRADIRDLETDFDCRSSFGLQWGGQLEVDLRQSRGRHTFGSTW